MIIQYLLFKFFHKVFLRHPLLLGMAFGVVGVWGFMIPAFKTGQAYDQFVGGKEVVAQVVEIRQQELAAVVAWCSPAAPESPPPVKPRRSKKKPEPAPCPETQAVMQVPRYLLPDEKAPNPETRLRVGSTVPIVISRLNPETVMPAEQLKRATLLHLGAGRAEGGNLGIGIAIIVIGGFLALAVSKLRASGALP